MGDLVMLSGTHPLGRGKSYPESVKAAAFELWWLHCDRSPSQVAEVLSYDAGWRTAAGLADGEPAPGADTISSWSKKRDWDMKVVENLREHAPWSMGAAAVKIAAAMNPAVDRIIELSETGTREQKVQLDAAMFLASPARDAMSELLKPAVAANMDIGDLSNLTVEELAERERDVIEGRSRSAG